MLEPYLDCRLHRPRIVAEGTDCRDLTPVPGVVDSLVAARAVVGPIEQDDVDARSAISLLSATYWVTERLSETQT